MVPWGLKKYLGQAPKYATELAKMGRNSRAILRPGFTHLDSFLTVTSTVSGSKSRTPRNSLQLQTLSEIVFGVVVWGLNTLSEGIWSTRDYTIHLVM